MAAKMTIVEMWVHMDCSGCERKIRKAIQKQEGVDNVDIDTARQKVMVTGWMDQMKVLKAVRKTGRRAVLWHYPDNAEYHTNTHHYYHQQHHPTSTTHHHLAYASPSSSYNYRKHGYDDSYMHSLYYQPPANSIIERARALFSDENANACSIM